jgi:hypothetical protein
MTRISSKMTFLQKRVFPVIWFGFLAVFIVVALSVGGSGANVLPGMVAPAVMAVIGFVIMKKLVWDLVDEVWDSGDALVVRNGGQEERIALADIMNVSYSAMSNPQRTTLTLRRPSSFGDKVTFCAKTSFIPFASNPTIDELIRRIDAARRR